MVGALSRRLGGVVLLALLASCATPRPDPDRVLTEDREGRIWFESGDGAIVDGVLVLPRTQFPAPAVILLHGCSGRTETIPGWERALLSWGFATFAVDSLTGRGVSETCITSRVAVWSRALDANAARRLIATHPRIDADRIAVMGFSHGGTTVLQLAGHEREYGLRGDPPVDGPLFRAYVAFYPACNVWFGQVSGATAPIRIHVGELDNWTPARWCVRVADTLQGKDADIRVTVYKGAHHSFDNLGVPIQFLPRVLNYGECESATTVGCLKRGATAGYSTSATAEARKNVRLELETLARGGAR
jgi:dienelactone hydrolase